MAGAWRRQMPSLIQQDQALTFFKKVFGHERDAAGKSLDRLVLTLIVIGTLFGLYSCYGQ
jgi:hypothetical protein